MKRRIGELRVYKVKERHNEVAKYKTAETKYKTAEIAKKEREANEGSIG